jgi:hypothetical protein
MVSQSAGIWAWNWIESSLRNWQLQNSGKNEIRLWNNTQCNYTIFTVNGHRLQWFHYSSSWMRWSPIYRSSWLSRKRVLTSRCVAMDYSVTFCLYTNTQVLKLTYTYAHTNMVCCGVLNYWNLFSILVVYHMEIPKMHYIESQQFSKQRHRYLCFGST